MLINEAIKFTKPISEQMV